jgi:serine/threonine protein phosphatase PrpC
MKLKRFASKTHQGPYLELNEDEMDINLTDNLFFVIDGFGGSGVGDKVAGMVKENLKTSYTKIGHDPDATMPFFYSPKYLLEANALINAFHSTHYKVKQRNEAFQMQDKGGASALAVTFSENIVNFVSVGNCKAVLYRKGHISLVTIPDSLNSFSQDQIYSANQTCPMSGIGLFDDLHLIVKELKLLEDDQLILMTDGVYSRLHDDDIKYILDRNELPYHKKIDELFKLVNERGNLDNQTTILLHF